MMTNKLEKQFFNTFGIKPLIKNIPCSECEFMMEECGCFDCYRETYPPITDRILLELICIANQHRDYPTSTNIKNIQARTLRILIKTAKLMYKYYGPSGRYKKLVKRVCALFKEVLK